MTKVRLPKGVRRVVQLAITIGAFAFGGAVVFVIGMLFQSSGSASFDSWSMFRDISVAFALMGAMYGTIAALDSTSDFGRSQGRWLKKISSTPLRIVLCSGIGAALVAFLQSSHGETLIWGWVLIGGVVGAVIGWLGWGLAKYVNF